MSQLESIERLETFWRNVYLRGPMLFDPTGEVAGEAYGQPFSGLPRSRGFVIGPDGRVALAVVGHDPDRITATLRNLLNELPPAGDGDGDEDVDLWDVAAYRSCVSGPNDPVAGSCVAFDLDYDRDVDRSDFAVLQRTFDGGVD
jgi:hypothetical protein